MPRLFSAAGVLLALFCAASLSACDLFGEAETPGPPTELTANTQERGLFLQWSAPEDFPQARYNVYRSTSEFSTLGEAEKVNSDLVRGTSYLDTSVKEEGTSYYYRVGAVNDGAESELSNLAGRTRFPTPPDTP